MNNKFYFVITLGVLLVLSLDFVSAAAPCRGEGSFQIPPLLRGTYHCSVVGGYLIADEGVCNRFCIDEKGFSGGKVGGSSLNDCGCSCNADYSGCCTFGSNLLNSNDGEDCSNVNTMGTCEDSVEELLDIYYQTTTYTNCMWSSMSRCIESAINCFECTTTAECDTLKGTPLNPCKKWNCNNQNTCEQINKDEDTPCGINGKCKIGVCTYDCTPGTVSTDCKDTLSDNCKRWTCNNLNKCEEVPDSGKNGNKCDPCIDISPKPPWCTTGVSARDLECGQRRCRDGSCSLKDEDAIGAGQETALCMGTTELECMGLRCDGKGFCKETQLPKFSPHPVCAAFDPPTGANWKCKVNLCNENGWCTSYRRGVQGTGTTWPADYRTFPVQTTCSEFSSPFWTDVQTLGLDNTASSCCGIPVCYRGDVAVGSLTYTYGCVNAETCKSSNGYYPAPDAGLRCTNSDNDGKYCCYTIKSDGGSEGGSGCQPFCPPGCPPLCGDGNGGGGGGCGAGQIRCLDGSCQDIPPGCGSNGGGGGTWPPLVNPPIEIPTEMHSICTFNGNCIAVKGVGTSQCKLDSDCSASPFSPTGFHTECSGGKCEQINGAGNNRCLNDGQCAPGVHTICENYVCKTVSDVTGNEGDICAEDIDCPLPQWFFNTSMVDGKCSTFVGVGESTCMPYQDTSNCTLTAAYWNTTRAKQGGKVKLIVNGTNCSDGISVMFIVKENSTNIPVVSQPINANFFKNQSITNWTAEWQDDSDEGGDGNPEYYFNASLVYNSSNSIISGKEDSKLLHVTPSITGTSTVYWENLKGEKISKSNLGDNVYAVIEMTTAGQMVEYRILKIDGCCFIGCVDCDALLPTTPFRSITSINGKNRILWKAGDMTDKLSKGIFYIEARINGGAWSNTKGVLPYGELEVSAEDDNNPPYASITGPKDKQIYFLNEILNFTGIYGDEDDDFNYTWDLGDGTIKSGNSSNLLNYNFTYAYSTTGQKNILLTVNDARGKTARYMISILIVNSAYILAYIDEPKWGEMSYGKVIDFNASSTYVVNVSHTLSGGIDKIECLAGACPVKTEGCPPPAVNYPTCQIQIPGTAQFPNPNWAGFENINFSWVFDDGSTRNKSGKAGAVFNKTYAVPGYHWGMLNASINPSGVIKKDFGNKFPYCVRDSNPVGMWDFFVSGEYTFRNYMHSLYNCSKNYLMCCPAEAEFSSCNQETGKCEAGFISCKSFTSKETCDAENGHPGIAYLELNDKLKDNGYSCSYERDIEDCRNSVNCLCKWDTSANNGNGACKPAAEYSSISITSSTCTIKSPADCSKQKIEPDCGKYPTKCSYDTGECADKGTDCGNFNNNQAVCKSDEHCTFNSVQCSGSGSCYFDINTIGDCSQTSSVYTSWVTTKGTSIPFCKDGQKSMPCPAQLGFVSEIGMIIAVLLISMIYLGRWTGKK